MQEFLKMLNTIKPNINIPLSHYQTENWRTLLNEVLGKTAIFITNNKKDFPKLVKVKKIYNNMVILEETLYTKSALPREKINISISYSSFICGDSRLVIINE